MLCSITNGSKPGRQAAVVLFCYAGRIFSSLFGGHTHPQQPEGPPAFAEQPGSAHTAGNQAVSRQTAPPDGTPDTETEGAGSQPQPQPEMHDVDESMAETDAQLHSAQQAQRSALQAEQESLAVSRESLVQLRQSMQQGMAQPLFGGGHNLLESCSLAESPASLLGKHLTSLNSTYECEYMVVPNELSDFTRLVDNRVATLVYPDGQIGSFILYLIVRGYEPDVTHQIGKHSWGVAPEGSLHTLNLTFQLWHT